LLGVFDKEKNHKRYPEQPAQDFFTEQSSFANYLLVFCW